MPALANCDYQQSKSMIHRQVLEKLNLEKLGRTQADVAREEVLALVARKPPELHLVLTGRGAPPELIEVADLVSEVKPIKHPYERGIKAQRGIEF